MKQEDTTTNPLKEKLTMTEDQARALLSRVKLCFDIARLLLASMPKPGR